jgi:hypothetical protein
MISLALLCIAAVACGGGGTSGDTPSGSPPSAFGLPPILPSVRPSQVPVTGQPPCAFPPKLSLPRWYPGDLPLPPRTYTSQVLADSFGYNRAIFVVPGPLPSFARFVLTEWPKAGWTLGRGDAEAGEIEDQFGRPPAVGAFKAQAQYCHPGYSLLLIIYAMDRSGVGATPGTQGGSPIQGSPSPSP